MSTYSDDLAELKSALMEKVRNELPVLRAKVRISQESMAEKIGISRQTYSSLETGKREMTWTTFLALIAYFQNNDQTRQMLEYIEGFSDGMQKVMESSEKIVN